MTNLGVTRYHLSLSQGDMVEDPEGVYVRWEALLNEHKGRMQLARELNNLRDAHFKLLDENNKLSDALARWESPDNWGAFVELLDLPPDHINKPLGVAAAIALLKNERDRLRYDLEMAHGPSGPPVEPKADARSEIAEILRDPYETLDMDRRRALADKLAAENRTSTHE